MRVVQRGALALLLLTGAGCGGDDLSREVVTSLPAGTAVGTGASGSYTIALTVRSCGGGCRVQVGEHSGSVCEVGETSTETVELIQEDGRLQVRLDLGLVLRGGIEGDGSFDVGGYGGGSLAQGQGSLTARAQGAVAAGGQITAQFKALLEGSVYGASIHCRITGDVTGERRGQ